MPTQFENLEHSQIKMTVNIPNQEFEKYRALGFKKLQAVIEIDGFRKGHAPENIIIQKYGEIVILEEMANLAINEIYLSAILKENENRKEDDKIFPIEQPKIVITKLGKGSDFEFAATFTTLPEVYLPDYKKISEEEIEKMTENKANQIEVTDQEVTDVLKNLAKSRVPQIHTHEDGTVHDENHEENSGLSPALSSGKGGNAGVPLPLGGVGVGLGEAENSPVLDDKLAQSFGPDFKTLEDLKNKIKSNLQLEKESVLIDKKRAMILEKLTNETKCEVPNILINLEIQKMKFQIKADVEKFGHKWEEYLEHLKKTEEALENDWREIAIKRAKTQLLLNKIAKIENLKLTEEEIDVEVIKLMNQIPDADANRTKDYVSQILLNEKVLKMLEFQS